MRKDGLYEFDEADAALSLLPMAARRALDAAGRHLPLAAWGKLAREDRVRLVTLGAQERVDERAVLSLLGERDVEAAPAARIPEPPRHALPADVSALLDGDRPLSPAAWSALSALDRYVLMKLASRGKRDRFAAAYDEIVGAREERG